MENETDQQPAQMPAPSEPSPMQPPNYAARRNNVRRKKRWLLIGGAVAVALLLAAAAVWFFVLRGDKPKPAPATTQQQTPGPEQTAPVTPADNTPVTYKSTKLNIEFTHRKDWTMKEATGGTEIILTSPSTSYVAADGTADTNVFTLKIRKGATDAMKATIEKAVAARDSEVIAYAAPTESQRFYTNVSYAGTGTGDKFNFFIVTGSTEIKAGKPFAYMLVLDSDSYVIAGGYGADKNSSFTFDPVPKDSIDSDAEAQALDIIKSLKIF